MSSPDRMQDLVPWNTVRCGQLAEETSELPRYQVYAWDQYGTLNHAGVSHSPSLPTLVVVTGWEALWAAWRTAYLADHPGDYPLRQHNLPSVAWQVWPVGNPAARQTFFACKTAEWPLALPTAA